MLQYIIDIPYERRESCTEIGVQINNIEGVFTLILCYNKKKQKVFFYLECNEKCINKICVSKIVLASTIFIAQEFWEKIVVSDWIIYTFLEGRETYNRIMVNKIFKF